MLIILSLLALVTALAFYLRHESQQKKKLDLPGPRGWPLVGNLFQLDSRRPDLTMVEWAKQYGPIYVMYILNTPYVVASSYDAMNEVLVTKGRIFGGRGKPFRRMYLTFNGKDITAGDQTSPHWLPLRKASQKVMRQSGESYTSVETLVLQMSEEFVTKVAAYNEQPVDIRNDIYDFTTKIAFLMITGKKPADNDAICSLQRVIAFERATQTGFGTKGLELDVFPWLRHLGHPMYAKLIQARQLHLDMWDTLWADYQATKPADGEASDRTDLMHMAAQMLDPKSPAYQKDLDMENMKGLFWNILIGSVASTTATLYSLINILLHYPAVLKKLQAEVDTVIGSKRNAQVEDREKMPYMASTLLELLRYNSISPSFPHAAIEDTTLQSHFIPAGTIVLPLYGALHREEQFWGDPWTFRPERFLAEDGSLLPPDHPTRRHMFVFGAGARVCAGEVFALKRLFLFTTTLIQAFDLQPGDTMTSCHPDEFSTGNVLNPPSFTVRLVKRKPAAAPIA